MTRKLLILFAILWCAPALARIKIDRYEKATLPEVVLWVTLLDGTRPLSPADVTTWTVLANGQLLPDAPDVTTAAELGRPVAVAAVIDARAAEAWAASRVGLEKALARVPRGSVAFGIATAAGFTRLPEKGWSNRPADLAGSFMQYDAGGEKPALYVALYEALHSYPLAPGLEKEKSDGFVPPPPGEDKPPFPDDRVLYVVGDGEIEVENVGASAEERLRELVHLARRRGVRIMAVGVAEDGTDHISNLQILARKTGGTFRLAPAGADITDLLDQAAAEIAGRFVVTAEVPGLRLEEQVTLQVRARARGEAHESRELLIKAENEMSWFEKGMDTVATTWEHLPWWAQTLIIVGVCLVAAVIVLFVLVRKARRAREERKAAEEARYAALAARKPCTVCGRMMMPDWPSCLFCAQTRAAETPKRYRLTGKSGAWAGHAVRFDKELITLGSGQDVDVQVPERGVAAQHAGLRDRGGNEFVLTDFNTDTGTWVNGSRITQIRVGEGDTIRIGDTEFVFGIEAD